VNYKSVQFGVRSAYLKCAKGIAEPPLRSIIMI